jgi:hypothetical protein
MSTKAKILLSALVILVSAAVGRFTAPEKIKTVEVEKQTNSAKDDSEKDIHKKVVETKVTQPDGTVTDTKVTTDDSVLSNKSTDTSVTTDEKSKEIVRSSGVLRVQALIGTPITNPSLTYGASVSRNLIGPISVGVFGLSSGMVGGSVGIDF